MSVLGFYCHSQYILARVFFFHTTSIKTNISPEHWWLEDEYLFKVFPFQGTRTLGHSIISGDKIVNTNHNLHCVPKDPSVPRRITKHDTDKDVMTFRMFSRELLIFMQCPDLKKHHLPLLILTTPLLPLRNVTIRWWLKSSGKVVDELHSILVGGFNPFEKIWVKMGIFHKWGGENKHIFELPPPTFSLWNVSFNFLGVRLPNQHDLLIFFSTRTPSFLSIPTAMAWTSRVNPFREHRICWITNATTIIYIRRFCDRDLLGVVKTWPFKIFKWLSTWPWTEGSSWVTNWITWNRPNLKTSYSSDSVWWMVITFGAPFCHPKFMIPDPREVTYPYISHRKGKGTSSSKMPLVWGYVSTQEAIQS